MDQPSEYVLKETGMTERLALIRVRSPVCVPGELIVRSSRADRSNALTPILAA